MPLETHRVRLESIEQAFGVIDPVFLRTHQFVCELLSEALGVRVAINVETINPCA